MPIKSTKPETWRDWIKKRTPVKPRRKPRHIEDDEQAAFFTWVRSYRNKHEAFKTIFAIPNGGNREAREAKRLVAQGVEAGVWDVLMAWPILSIDGFYTPGLWIEFKAVYPASIVDGKKVPTRKGVLSEDQKIWRERMLMLGYRCVVAYDWAEAARTVIEYLGWKPEHYGVEKR